MKKSKESKKEATVRPILGRSVIVKGTCLATDRKYIILYRKYRTQNLSCGLEFLESLFFFSINRKTKLVCDNPRMKLKHFLLNFSI